MKRDEGLCRRELDELMERGRSVPPLSDVVRARARARATAAVRAAATPAPAVTAPAGAHGLRIALAASIALVLGAAGAVAAMALRTADWIDRAPASSAVPAPTSRLEAPELPVPSPAPAEPKSSLAKLHRSTRPAPARESYAAELALLQGAQVAYADRDFSGALVLVAEHARRFPNGRLTEEREALRVRSLARSGQTEEARRAAGTFANRFPGSVLLPHLRQIAGTPN